MSGISRGDPEDVGENRRAFEFVMENNVPPYLIAIAAGNIEFAELGPRSGVWAEPEMLEEAAAELTDTEAMIDAAEEIYGTYRWGRYDMIVLPPSFPYGGMENPVMTFLTPTFIAGDRSNTGLIAHELAHSWSGNLVTYSSWRDGWLNEGVTSYFESRISEAVFGEERANQEYALSYASAGGSRRGKRRGQSQHRHAHARWHQPLRYGRPGDLRQGHCLPAHGGDDPWPRAVR